MEKRMVEVSRNWQNDFVKMLEAMGFDSYGHPLSMYEDEYNEKLKKVVPSQSKYCKDYYRYENDVFVIMPYYWGESDAISELPNFIYKPTGFELSWYKYPLRSSYMNQDITKGQLLAILNNCLKSLRGEKLTDEELKRPQGYKIETIEVENDDGHIFTLLHHEAHGGITVLKDGVLYSNETGNDLVHAMFKRIQELEKITS